MKGIRTKCREFVIKHSSGYDASHDISHIDRVVTNSIRILENSDQETRSKISRDVLIAISSLHDSFDHKYLTTPEAVEKAKAQVTDFLSHDCGFEHDVIIMIISVIDNMGFTSEVSGADSSNMNPITVSYLHIVQDADRLDAIGAIGVARCLAFTGAFGRAIISPDGSEERLQRAQFKEGALKAVARKGGSAIGHFYDKLVFLKDMLKTPAGRKLGEKRHAFICQFLDEFFDEIGE